MNQDESMKNYIQLSFKEEVGNSVTHAIMAFILLFSLPVVSIYGYTKGGYLLGIGYGIFIISLFMMFMSSALYHAMAYDSKHKYVFRILDHIFIYVAIAGSYTPICLYVIGGKFGYTILVIQWLMVLFGILYKSIAQKSIPKISVSIYLAMGWAGVIAIPAIYKSTSLVFIGLIALGGVLYSIGAWFYMQKDKPYFHMIWHLFINGASLAHLIAIIFYIK
ncbi:MAG TPA: hemolysin III family protein [Erysipelothrix sp.]|nr:hemolysin III family protein [Erysipelothrix sp.]